MNASAVHAYVDELLDAGPPRAVLAPVPSSPMPSSPPPQPEAPATPQPIDAGHSDIARTGRWLRLRVGEGRYAFALLRVQEVVRPAPIVALRGSAPALLGAMNLRGRIVPVYDLGRWLASAAATPGEQARVVIVERDDVLIGLLVCAVEDVVTIAAADIETAPNAAASGALLGIARPAGVPVVLLDAAALFE